MNQETKQCQNCKKDFIIEPDDFAFYEKMKVPAPMWCPDCRMIRRMLFRNERTWYRRKCDATGENILAVFAPEKPYKVYKQDYWRSDAWDPLDYGREYNFLKPFFQQFNDLFVKIPHPNLIQKNIVDSDYSNNVLNMKNCYFVASVDGAEDCAYCFGAVLRAKNSFDLHQSTDTEYSYELIDCQKSNKLFFSQYCDSCLNSWFLYDCRNCSNCFGCVGLRNKQYYIFNRPYSKEEYHKELEEMFGGYTNLMMAKEKFNNLKLQVPRKFASIIKSENVLGNDITNSRNCYRCFDLRNDVENERYVFRSFDHSRDGADAYGAWNGAELFYECLSITAQRVIGSSYIWGGFDIQYSHNCFDCNNIFGCIGLRNKSYCILNKQYSKEDYEALILKIVGHMRKTKEYGEFFPPSIAPFAYNETVAQEYFQTTKEKALANGFNWRDPEEKQYKITRQADNLPENIKDVSDEIMNDVIGCVHKGKCNEQCAAAFKIIPLELQFYRQFGVPLPRLCPSCRHGQRLALKNPIKLWHGKCQCSGQKSENRVYKNTAKHFHGDNPCPNEFETSYSPDRPEMVYCESCYNNEVA